MYAREESEREEGTVDLISGSVVQVMVKLPGGLPRARLERAFLEQREGGPRGHRSAGPCEHGSEVHRCAGPCEHGSKILQVCMSR